MSFTTKIDLSQQARIPSGSTANFDGSMNIMTDFFIKNIKINPSNSAASGDLLLYNSITNSYNKGVLSGTNGINIYPQNGNLFVEFTGATATNARVASLANLSTNGILVNSGSTILTVLITGSSDFTFTNANGIGGNPTISLSNTGVSGGTYGSSASIPVLTVDNKGRITSVSGVTVNIPTNYITNINGLTAYTQSFVTTTTGTTFNINSSGSNHYFSLPYASGISVTLGGISNNEYNTFNNKQNTISLTVTGNSGPSTFVSNVLNIPNYSLSGLGGLALTGGTLTGELTGTSFVVSGGISTQFLKANGQLDYTPNNSFTGLTYSGGTLTFINLTGGTSLVTGLTSLNGTGYTFVSGTSVSYKYGTSTQFLKADGSLDSNSYLPLSGGKLTGALDFANITTVASASNVDIVNIASNTAYITGTTGITTFTAGTSGMVRFVQFAGVLVLQGGNNIRLPNAAATLTTSAKDFAIFEYNAIDSLWYCVAYTRGSVSSLTANRITYFNGTDIVTSNHILGNDGNNITWVNDAFQSFGVGGSYFKGGTSGLIVYANATNITLERGGTSKFLLESGAIQLRAPDIYFADFASSVKMGRWTTSGLLVGSHGTINGRTILQIDSTTKGFQPPRMTSTERGVVSWNNTTDKGMVIYNTTTDKLQCWDGTVWNDLF